MSSPNHNTYGGWLPQNPDIIWAFFVERVKEAKKTIELSGGDVVHHPAVEAFKKAIEADQHMNTLFGQIFEQAKAWGEYHQVKSFEMLLGILDIILKSGPPFQFTLNGTVGEPVGVPIYVTLDVLSNTAAAYDLFRLPDFNEAMKDLLNTWGNYLSTDPTSSLVLHRNDEGWFGGAGTTQLEMNLRGRTFDQTYISPDETKPDRGYPTWDAFFVREFKEGVRPIESRGQDTQDRLIHSACESTMFHKAEEVGAHNLFWLKSRNYSMHEILNRDAEMVPKFVGGTIYQAFLSPLDYHRWHAPINCTVERIVTVKGGLAPGGTVDTVGGGTYYAAIPDTGVAENPGDHGNPHGALIRSQSFLSIVATRVLIYIRSRNEDIGLICFVGVGMVEVSTCEVKVGVGQEVKIGQELGLFHFGGSTHILIFGPDCDVHFEPEVGKHIWVNEVIGVVPESKK
ncbi:phosphatidylserine decarboxylase [Athelia psychrophila]|uniref:Phosphatidylserine decarboxylase n=1 Tax=Athelia psychrophila TaxID=1759441 RepID=A0A166PNS5_9AGAM|nr:phosphatidylserine decarboxylase [Fibularhizoctonia sp. CBS 109695]